MGECDERMVVDQFAPLFVEAEFEAEEDVAAWATFEVDDRSRVRWGLVVGEGGDVKADAIGVRWIVPYLRYENKSAFGVEAGEHVELAAARRKRWGAARDEWI